MLSCPDINAPAHSYFQLLRVLVVKRFEGRSASSAGTSRLCLPTGVATTIIVVSTWRDPKVATCYCRLRMATRAVQSAWISVMHLVRTRQPL